MYVVRLSFHTEALLLLCSTYHRQTFSYTLVAHSPCKVSYNKSFIVTQIAMVVQFGLAGNLGKCSETY